MVPTLIAVSQAPTLITTAHSVYHDQNLSGKGSHLWGSDAWNMLVNLERFALSVVLIVIRHQWEAWGLQNGTRKIQRRMLKLLMTRRANGDFDWNLDRGIPSGQAVSARPCLRQVEIGISFCQELEYDVSWCGVRGKGGREFRKLSVAIFSVFVGNTAVSECWSAFNHSSKKNALPCLGFISCCRLLAYCLSH